MSFYFCYGSDGGTLEFIVAEVSNTPWGEQDCYVLRCSDDNRAGSSWRFRPKKKMHVSPFMPMDIEYDWALMQPAERLSVHMANSRNGERFFSAGMSLQRREISSRSLAGVLLRFPFQTLKIIAAIHWQALRLWLKRCPFYAHPDKSGKPLRQS